jgi:hypothetical protein
MGTDPTPRPPDGENLRTVYTATTDHWIHAEETRWSLLYNYCMASSILLIAWAEVFTSNHACR